MKNITIIFFLALLFSCGTKSKSSTEKEIKRESTFPTNINQSNELNNGIIFFSSNNGLTWESKNEGLPDTISIGLGGIAVSNSSLAIATKEKGIYLFNFGKNRWNNIPTDNRIIESNPGTLTFYQDRLYIGTQLGGVFYTADMGKNWTKVNSGLVSLTIRKLVQIDNKLYAATNAGLYSLNETGKKWELEYGSSTLQVNGVTEFDGSIYIGTNQGAFTSSKNSKEWRQILANRSLHNISSDDNTIYAMGYNELLSSVDKGQTWQNIQYGLPAQLYTFNVVKNGNSVFAGQWDGVYRKDKPNEIWKSSSYGLPVKFTIANMKIYNGIIVVCGSERKLKTGMTTDK